MIIIPREKPAIEHLNSYYLNIEKLIEHYQGDVGAGAVYFKSPVAEGAIFFDEDSLVNGCYEDRKRQRDGQKAIDRILELSERNNFSVSVFRILPERIYFWANLSNSQTLYSDLTTDFTDLEGLIKKMESEKLTGYVDVELNGDTEGGLLFFHNGEVIGGSSSEGAGNLDRSKQYRDDLIQRSRQSGGKFNVSKIFLDSRPKAPQSAARAKPRPAKEQGGAAGRQQPDRAGPSGKAQKKSPPQPSRAGQERVLEMLQELLATMDKLVHNNKKIRFDFETLLNKKFVEKVDQYEFLDPFAAEFKYADGKITFRGHTEPAVLVKAIVGCVTEIANDIGLTSQLRKQLDAWRRKFADEIFEFDIRL
ncbi:MAG: hypothetical protein ACQERN_01960 [Thermodesulfobacteriota bacterium]